MNFTHLIVPDADGEPYYCISADGKEISLENYENGLRGFICEHCEVTSKASTLVAKLKAPDGRSYTIEIAPSGKVLKATFYDGEVKLNSNNFLAFEPVQGEDLEKFLRKQCGL